MTASAHKHTAGDRELAAVHLRQAPVPHLYLRPTEDGWSLITHDGALVFRGFGVDSRRQCLRYARQLGALAVLA